MIYRKTWASVKEDGLWFYDYEFEGVFLFGFIPLYVNRVSMGRR
jgi:hypothetical protein